MGVGVIKTPVDIRDRKNVVKEEIIRLTTDASITDGTEEMAYLHGGSTGQVYEVRTGECAELLALGNKAQSNQDYVRIVDKEGTQWNKFLTHTDVGKNELPLNLLQGFEQLFMSWGYKSLLESTTTICPTLKVARGDEINTYVGASGGDISTATPIVYIIRRFMAGAKIEYNNFNLFDGGLASPRIYFSEYSKLATTTTSTWTQLYQKEVLKNEAYKFFSTGIWPGVLGGTAGNLEEAKIMIDDPEFEYNRYYVDPTYNQLPFVNTYEIDTSYDPTITASVTQSQVLEHMHRHAPTIDIKKDHNHDVRIWVKDDGTAETNVVSVMKGIKLKLERA
jgi:hypothetical protein